MWLWEETPYVEPMAEVDKTYRHCQRDEAKNFQLFTKRYGSGKKPKMKSHNKVYFRNCNCWVVGWFEKFKKLKGIHSDRLDPNYFCVYVFWAAFFSFFFFFLAAIVDFVNCKQYIRVLFTVPQITLFSHFFIKNGSHSTIYTFKNYFATVFSVSIFSFSKNKLNPNRP